MKTKLYLFLIFISSLVLSCGVQEDLPLNTENTIVSIAISKGSTLKEFTISKDTIKGKVSSDFELEQIKLAIEIPKGATISPDPSTITSITEPLTFIITAEDGQTKTYTVVIEREKSIDNFILEFNINNPLLSVSPKIEETGVITKRLPEFIDLKNLNVVVKYSKYATISPDPNTITDYSSPIEFTVKSESGIEKTYQVKLEHMDIDRSESCSEANSWMWFGGDNRTNAPDILPYDRNIGIGQAVKLNKDLTPSTFSVNLREGFRYDETQTLYKEAVTLKLMIRDENGKMLGSTTTNVLGTFDGGFIPFDLKKLNLLFEANKTYVFYWYLVNGESLGITASSSGNANNGTGFCFESGYYGQSNISKKTNIEDPTSWYKHEWHFNIQLEGKE